MRSSDQSDMTTVSSSQPPPSQYHLPCHCTQPSSSHPANIIDVDNEISSKPEAEELLSNLAESSRHPAAKKLKRKAIHEDDISEDGLSETELDLSKCILYCDYGILTDLHI